MFSLPLRGFVFFPYMNSLYSSSNGSGLNLLVDRMRLIKSNSSKSVFFGPNLPKSLFIRLEVLIFEFFLPFGLVCSLYSRYT